MRLIEFSSPEPAVNLALEEVLLDEVEQGSQPSTLRFWESPVPFVVVGTGQAVAREVHVEHCAADGVPIMRRCTAGGCVLQGPGSLNYSLSLTYAEFPETATLHPSYHFILGRIRQALATLGLSVAQEGISDIALDGHKISGNAQRRRRNALLHHGTLLYGLDIKSIARYIREPEDQPEYRSGRAHDTFLTAIAAAPDDIRRAIAAAFDAPWPPAEVTMGERLRAQTLALEKYDLDTWIYRR